MHYQIHAIEGVRFREPINVDLATGRDAVEYARALAIDFARDCKDGLNGVHLAVEDDLQNLVGSVAVKFLRA